MEVQLAAATEAAQAEWQRAEALAEELEEARGDNQRLAGELQALQEARGDNQREDESSGSSHDEVEGIEGMRAAVAHVVRQSEDRAVGAAALTAAGTEM